MVTHPSEQSEKFATSAKNPTPCKEKRRPYIFQDLGTSLPPIRDIWLRLLIALILAPALAINLHTKFDSQPIFTVR